MLGNFSCFCCHLQTSFKINFFKEIFEEHYQCQIVWIQIKTDVMIWVQTVCKGYQQMTKVMASKEKVEELQIFSNFIAFLTKQVF